jgi:hypothetical protein
MKTPLTTVFLAVAALCAGAPASADSIAEVYSCELKEGKQQEELQAANSKWLKWVRENVSENISSSVGTAVVGDQSIFLFVDSYPDLATWAAAQTALDGDAASALETLFDEISECSENRLWKLEPTP